MPIVSKSIHDECSLETKTLPIQWCRYFIRFWGAALTCLIASLLANQGVAQRVESWPTETEFAELDQAVVDFKRQINASGATLSVSYRGRLIHAKAFGSPDLRRRGEMTPDRVFRIASVTKPITSAVVRELIDSGKLDESELVFDRLEFGNVRRFDVDDRIDEITIQHLLDHQGGWDRSATFDPVFKGNEIKEELRLRGPAQINHMIQYMLRRPLQFDPGERTAYSNFGFVLLGELIEDATSNTYLDAVQMTVAKEIGATDLYAANSNKRTRIEKEVQYPSDAYRFRVELVGAAGGLVTSAPTLCRFMDHYWLSGVKRDPRERQEWVFFGSLPGTTAMARQHPSGFNIAVLLNNRRDRQVDSDNNMLKHHVDEAIEKFISERRGGE